MTHPLDDLPFFRLVRGGLNGGVVGAAARDKFLGESAVTARALHLLGSRQDSQLDAVVTLVEKELNSSHQISLADNSLRMRELLYPYAALSNYIERIQFYEIWLDEFARERQLIPDRPKFLDCEEKFILYMAGRGTLPDLVRSSWLPFYKKTYDFDVEQCYILTHRYIYSTDFGLRHSAASWIAPALMIIVGKSALWGNFDLFFESAFCALSTNLVSQEVLLIDDLSKMFMPQLMSMLKQNDVQKTYHELFVYSLFKTQRERIAVAGTETKSIKGEVLTNFVAALGSKSPDKIVRCLDAIQSVAVRTFYNEMCIGKLAWLAATAKIKTLFENEVRSSGMELEPEVYDEYQRRVNVELDELRRLSARNSEDGGHYFPAARVGGLIAETSRESDNNGGRCDMAQFTTNAPRSDPYKNFRFRVKWDGRYVAGVSKVSGLKRTTEMVERRAGGDPRSAAKSPGRTKYEPITLERGVTRDAEFQQWVKGFIRGSVANVTHENLRKDLTIELYDGAGHLVAGYTVSGGRISKFVGPEFIADGTDVAMEELTLEHRGCECDRKEESVA